MRALVCGGRAYFVGSRVFEVLDAGHRKLTFSLIIQGGAPGADRLALEWARLRCVPCDTYSADWDLHGKKAGPLRNKKMLEEGKPDIVIAFPGGAGTANMVRQAREAGVRVVEVPAT